MLKLICLIFSSSLFVFNLLFWIRVETPVSSSKDIVGSTSVIDIEDKEDAEGFIFTTLIWTINKYLWYIFAVVAFALLLYIGYLLITSEWEEQWLKKANKTIVYGLVGLLIAIVSYAIVMFIVGLF